MTRSSILIASIRAISARGAASADALGRLGAMDLWAGMEVVCATAGNPARVDLDRVDLAAEFVLLLRTLSVPSVVPIEAPAVDGVIGEREREARAVHGGSGEK